MREMKLKARHVIMLTHVENVTFLVRTLQPIKVISCLPNLNIVPVLHDEVRAV